jgi:hypothetical protein
LLGVVATLAIVSAGLVDTTPFTEEPLNSTLLSVVSRSTLNVRASAAALNPIKTGLS